MIGKTLVRPIKMSHRLCEMRFYTRGLRVSGCDIFFRTGHALLAIAAQASRTHRHFTVDVGARFGVAIAHASPRLPRESRLSLIRPTCCQITTSELQTHQVG